MILFYYKQRYNRHRYELQRKVKRNILDRFQIYIIIVPVVLICQFAGFSK